MSILSERLLALREEKKLTQVAAADEMKVWTDRKSTRLNSSH